MEEGGPLAKRVKQGDGETEAPIMSTCASPHPHQKHEISSSNMAKLREGVGASLARARTVHGEITQVREGMDANRNEEARAIRDEILKLNSQLELQNSKLDFQTKIQGLAFAVHNAEENSFKYYGDGEQNQPVSNSRDLVLSILLCFRRGCPVYLPSTLGPMDRNQILYGDGDQRLLTSEQVFRDRLAAQIHELTGVRPRFVFKKEEDKYWIYYS